MANHEMRAVFGPFHRLLAPDVQDAETVVQQMLSGELWGHPARWGGTAAVKAYVGPLATEASGIEFWAFEAPDAPAGPRAYWRTPSPFVAVDEGDDLVRLRVAFVRITQDLHILSS